MEINTLLIIVFLTHSLLKIPGLENQFFPGSLNADLQKLPKGVVYRNQYIFGLPAEI